MLSMGMSCIQTAAARGVMVQRDCDWGRLAVLETDTTAAPHTCAMIKALVDLAAMAMSWSSMVLKATVRPIKSASRT